MAEFDWNSNDQQASDNGSQPRSEYSYTGSYTYHADNAKTSGSGKAGRVALIAVAAVLALVLCFGAGAAGALLLDRLTDDMPNPADVPLDPSEGDEPSDPTAGDPGADPVEDPTDEPQTPEQNPPAQNGLTPNQPHEAIEGNRNPMPDMDKSEGLDSVSYTGSAGENGYAYLPGSDVPVTQAVPGQEVRIRYDVNCIEPNEYFVWGSMAASSDDAEVSSMEMVDTWHLYMPDKDVSVHVSYETGIQKNTVLELYNGPVTVPEDNTQRSENFGAAAVLRMKAADNEYGDGVTNYDIDGDGSYDIQCANKIVYSLLPTCSLTHNVKLTTTRRETEHYPVRSVEILVKKAVSHKITVTGGGVATARRSDYANEYVLTEACEGETVYLMPKLHEIDEDSYVVQFSMSASSADVHIIDEPVPEFVMPDKDVTVSFDFECRVQKNSVLDFSSGKTVSVPANPEETGARSESYGVSMVFRLASVSQTDVSDTVRRFDVDGNGSCDIEQNTADNSYTLLDTNSLPTGYALVLSREDSWTLPVRTVRIELPRPAPVRGDANRDGKITIDDATLLQRHLAEYLNPFGKGLINEDDEDWFFCIDANKDGRINVRDVTAIQRMLAES